MQSIVMSKREARMPLVWFCSKECLNSYLDGMEGEGTLGLVRVNWMNKRAD